MPKFYVYQPRKTRPKSQRHPPYCYGPFETREAAEAWKREKGLDIYPRVIVTDEPNQYIVEKEEKRAN